MSETDQTNHHEEEAIAVVTAARAEQIIDSITVVAQAITDDGMLETIIAIEEDGAMVRGVALHEWDSVNGQWKPSGDCRQCWLSSDLEAAVSQVRDREWERVVVAALDDAARSEAIRARRTGGE